MWISGRDNENLSGMCLTDEERINIYKEYLNKLSSCEIDGALLVLDMFDYDNYFELLKKALSELIFENGSRNYSLIKRMLKRGYILENVEEECVNVKMVDKKLFGYYDGEGWVEVSDSIIESGKWKPKNDKIGGNNG